MAVIVWLRQVSSQKKPYWHDYYNMAEVLAQTELRGFVLGMLSRRSVNQNASSPITLGKETVSFAKFQRLFQIEAAWIIGNLAAGTDEEAMLMIDGPSGTLDNQNRAQFFQLINQQIE